MSDTARRDTPNFVSDRLSLRRRYHRTLHRHAWRDLVRLAVLMAGDVVTLLGGAVLLAVTRASATGAVDRLLASLAPSGAGSTPEIVLAVVAGLIACGSYAAGDYRRDPVRIFAGTAIGAALPFWSYLWARPSWFAVTAFLVAWAGIGTVILLERLIVDRVVRRVWPVSPEAGRTLLIATVEQLPRARALTALGDAREFVEAGLFDPDQLRGLREPQAMRRLLRAIRSSKADTIVLGGFVDLDTYTTIVDAADVAGCQLYATVSSLATGGIDPKVVWRRGEPMLALNRPALVGWQVILKRLLDVAGSVAALLLLSPLMAGVAVLVKATSRGPVFFRQVRIGLGGRPFTIFKFRSMVADAERLKAALQRDSVYADGRLFKLERDPRVTPIGRFLRRTSIDELPQLWNVLIGDMSLVGPRPPLPNEVTLYEAHHYLRFDVKPGITGPWQVSGRNQITDFERVIELETRYIRDWTLWSDVAIILRTVPTVLRGRGAH